jgi:hypothetical protein
LHSMQICDILTSRGCRDCSLTDITMNPLRNSALRCAFKLHSTTAQQQRSAVSHVSSLPAAVEHELFELIQ